MAGLDGKGVKSVSTLDTPMNPQEITNALNELKDAFNGISPVDVVCSDVTCSKVTVASDSVEEVFSFEDLGSTALADAGIGVSSAGSSIGGVASKVVRVLIDGTAYWMPLFISND